MNTSRQPGTIDHDSKENRIKLKLQVGQRDYDVISTLKDSQCAELFGFAGLEDNLLDI